MEVGTYEWLWKIFCDRLECEVRALDNGGVRVRYDGERQAQIHYAVSNAQASTSSRAERLGCGGVYGC